MLQVTLNLFAPDEIRAFGDFSRTLADLRAHQMAPFQEVPGTNEVVPSDIAPPPTVIMIPPVQVTEPAPEPSSPLTQAGIEELVKRVFTAPGKGIPVIRRILETIGVSKVGDVPSERSQEFAALLQAEL